MLRDRRHELIVHIVATEGPATVETLAERLATSAATIRRDLVQLAEQGMLRRVYGGAMPLDEHRDDPFPEVAATRAEEKDAIAVRCAEMVQDGETVLLDIGTTVHRVARRLRGRTLTVVTSSLAVLDELIDCEETRLVLLGGMVRRDYRSLVGFLTEDALRQINADRLFLGTSGVRRGGHVMDTTVVEVPVKRAMIAASDQVVLVADGGKFPGTGMARVCGPADLDVVVTNHQADPDTVADLREGGSEVITV
ncbi:DeoR/GlpR family DNA-binding transcription regulator [Actinomycetes bacterium KLBMP 9759]